MLASRVCEGHVTHMKVVNEMLNCVQFSVTMTLCLNFIGDRLLQTGTFLLYGFCFCMLFLLKTFRTTCTTEGFRHVGEFHIRKITVLGMHKAKMLHMCRDIVYRMSSRLIYNCVYTVIINNNLIKATQRHNNYHSLKSLRVSSSSF